MNLRLIVLICSVVVVLALGGYLVSPSQKDKVSGAPRVLLGELSQYANQLQTIEIESSGGLIFSAQKRQEEWVATHLDSVLTFPMTTDGLATLIGNLSQAKVIEEKTAKPENYPKLGVEGIDSEEAQSILIRLATDKKQWRVLVGNRASSGLGQYVRQPKQKRSYLIDQLLALPTTGTEWLSQDLPFLVSEDVASVTWYSSGASPLVLEKSSVEGETWQLVGMKAFEQPVYPDVFSQSFDDLKLFNFDGVRVNTLENAGNLSQDRVELRLLDGALVTLNIEIVDGSNSVEMTIAGEDIYPGLKDWVFEFSEFNGKPFLLKRSDLIQTEQAN